MFVKLRATSLLPGATGDIGSYAGEKLWTRRQKVAESVVGGAKKNRARPSAKFGDLDDSKNLPPDWRE